jgi:hypothetical protein
VQRTLGAADLDAARQAPADAGSPAQRTPAAAPDAGTRISVPMPRGRHVQRESRDPVERTQPVPRNGGERRGGAPDVGAEPLVPLVPPAAAEPVQRTLGAPHVDDRPVGSPVQREVGDPVPAASPGSAPGGGGLDTGRLWGAVPTRPPGELAQVPGIGDPVQRAAVDGRGPLAADPVGHGDPRVQRASRAPVLDEPPDPAGTPLPGPSARPWGEGARPLDPVGAATRLVVARFPEPAGSVALKEQATAGAGLIGDRPITPAPPATPAA